MITPDFRPSRALFAGSVLFVDNVAGSDFSGQRGRVDLPFQTFYAANKASLFGDLVVGRFGNGYYTDPVATACVAGRFYDVDPNILLSDHTLNAPYRFLGALSALGGGSTVNSLPPFGPTDVGREVVINWGASTQRYLVVSVGSGIATLSDTVPGSGAQTGTGYMVPGPMQTNPFMNGQRDGLIQFQRFNDLSTLMLTGSNITGTSVKYLADGVTPFAPLQHTNAPDTGSNPTSVTSGGLTYGQTATTSPSGLYAAVSSLNPVGRFALACTANVASLASSPTHYFCGENDSASALGALQTNSSHVRLAWGGATEVFSSIGTNTWFGTALAQNDASNGYWWLKLAGALTNGTTAGANSTAFTGNNYVIGGPSTLANYRVGGYGFFDGPASYAKLLAMLNLFLWDIGQY